MVQTSQDFFWIIFGLSIGLVSVVLSLAIFYMVLILRNANKVFSSVRSKIEVLDQIFRMIKDKFEKGSSHIAMIADSAIKLAGYVMERKKRDRKKED